MHPPRKATQKTRSFPQKERGATCVREDSKHDESPRGPRVEVLTRPVHYEPRPTFRDRVVPSRLFGTNSVTASKPLLPSGNVEPPSLRE